MSKEKSESTEENVENQEIVPRIETNQSTSSDYVELTIEDVAVDTVIDMRAYFQENGLIPKKPVQSYDLFRWISKQIKKK